MTIVGVHTPESDGEKVIDAVKKKAKEADFKFPIVVDNESKIWYAWTNHIWPSVYLVDKKGYVRWWWYGELNWEGSQGEKFMREKIEELLTERD